MKINKPVVTPPIFTHEGARAARTSPINQLSRSVMACLLWEDSFYEGGQSIAERIKELVHKCDAMQVVALAISARNEMKLRHVPLLLMRELCRHKDKHHTQLEYAFGKVIQRPDELAEFMAIYWQENKDAPIPNVAKRGLARAFTKFDAYSLAKYNQDVAIKLRDVMFLVHPKPKDEEQAATFKKLADGTLESPDTWETQLSAGKGKKATFERLILEKKLGALALLRNLRNMTQAGVEPEVIKKAIREMETEWVLPFRFITAAKYAPQLEPELEQAMFKCLDGQPKLKGKTAIVIDTSPSMWQAKVSAKSEMDRFDAAAALAILAREICEDVAVYAFNQKAYVVPPRKGFALRDSLAKTQAGYSCGGLAVQQANKDGYDRIIVLTDGQWHVMHADGHGYYSGDAVKVSPPPLTSKAYMINVSVEKNSVGYGKWTMIDGWSESCIRFIQELENAD